MHSLDTLILRLGISNLIAISLVSVSVGFPNTFNVRGPKLAKRVEVGQASWYGPGFHGHTAANGRTFDQTKLTAAHPTLPFGTYATVTNLNNGAVVQVRITDRGPYVHGRVLDLSKAAAQRLNMMQEGITLVQIETELPGSAH